MFSSFRRNSSSASLFMDSTTSTLNSSAKTHNKTIIQQWIISSAESVFNHDVLWLADWHVGVLWLAVGGAAEPVPLCRFCPTCSSAVSPKWISEKGSWSCELCNYRFNILPIHIKPPQQVNTHIQGFMKYRSGFWTKAFRSQQKW